MMLENRVAIITGATGSLGRVVAGLFARHGGHLALFGRNLSRLQSLAGDLRLPADRLLNQEMDLSVPKTCIQGVEATIEKFGRVDILLHLVGGYMGRKPYAEVAPNEITEMLQQHLWSTYNMTHALVPHFMQNGWGRIITVSSPSARQPLANDSSTAIARAAKEALILALAKELQGTDVTANMVLVRLIDTNHERDQNPSPKNAWWTTPEEIAHTLLHLCTDEARMINGARIPLYGGP